MLKKTIPDNFLLGLRESYKYIFYKVLLQYARKENTEGYRPELVVADMIVAAWSYVIEYQFSLGSSDQLEAICRYIFGEKGTDTPISSNIEEWIDDGFHPECVIDIKRVFARFADAWIGRTCNPDKSWLHSQTYTNQNYFPYYIGENDKIIINDIWRSFVISSNYGHDQLLEQAFEDFLYKRNRGKKKFKKSLALAFGHTKTQKKETPIEDIIASCGLSAEVFDEFKKIPIDFLFREPKILDWTPGGTYLKESPQKDIKFVADLFSVSLKKRVQLKTLQAYIIENQDRILKLFNYYSEPVMIPKDAMPGTSLGESLQMFIHEYVDRLSYRNSLLPTGEAKKRNVRLKIFESLFDDRIFEDVSFNSLAEELNLHPERIRQLQRGDETTVGIESCSNILHGKNTSEDFIVNPFLQSEYFSLAYSGFQAERKDTFDNIYGIPSDKTRAFLLSTLGLYYADSIRYVEPFIIKGENITVINRSIAKVMKFFTDNVTFVSIEGQLVPFMKKSIGLSYEVIDVIVGIIKHSEIFESSVTEEGEINFRLKWENLSTIPSRIARILADAGVPMHFSKAYDEYNRRGFEFGFALETTDSSITHVRHPFVRTNGRTGIWEFTGDVQHKRGNHSLMSIVEKYIIESGGMITLSGLREHLNAMGISANERSIRTYISQFCWPSKVKQFTYVHKEYVDKFPQLKAGPMMINDVGMVLPIMLKTLADNGGAASMRQIIDDYTNATGHGLRDTTLRTMIAKYENIVSCENLSGRRIQIKLMIPVDDIDKIDYSQISESSKPKFHMAIQNAILDILNEAPEHCAKMSEVVRSTGYLVPKDRHKNIIYKIISNMDSIEAYKVDNVNFVRLK